ncbi:MAG: hypothetical protein KAT16_08115, partial [Candidatus Heimdallarchaeota archaeon]|nr:hypothetical protein [Candidatus Heimdallarchaeota archaeon]
MAATTNQRSRFLHLRVIIDYLKTNGHRIAHHALSRTPTPLASRDDIKPILPLINGENIDILTLDPTSKKTFIKAIAAEGLIAHFEGDTALNESITSLKSTNMDNLHFIFVTNGILTPSLLEFDYLSEYPFITEITFLETRFDPSSIHKIGNPTIYLRKAISQVRLMDKNFVEDSTDKCECGGNFMQGSYQICYWEKNHKLKYSICNNCGIQKESAENA